LKQHKCNGGSHSRHRAEIMASIKPYAAGARSPCPACGPPGPYESVRCCQLTWSAHGPHGRDNTASGRRNRRPRPAGGRARVRTARLRRKTKQPRRAASRLVQHEVGDAPQACHASVAHRETRSEHGLINTAVVYIVERHSTTQPIMSGPSTQRKNPHIPLEVVDEPPRRRDDDLY
jgi:hypothetical protein